VAVPGEKQRTDQEVAGEALAHYRKAQDLLRQGNWAGFGEELRKMEEGLRTLEKKK
jgi:hypothetical protein